jgi:YesN/AraC family two-component response regulator
MTQTNTLPKKWRVLIADDAQETRRSTRLMLAALDNIEVVATAANGVQAIEMAKEHRPDIVLMDVNMPEMDGLTAYGQISQMYPDTACIVISAENDAATLNAAEFLGVQAYLTKPFILEELETAIEYVTMRLNEFRAKNTQPNHIVELERLATEYVKARRTDNESVRVFELLAENPRCNVHWLKTLVMIYAIRQEWGKLKSLAERLERETKK